MFSFQLLYKEVSLFQEVGIETVYRDVLISGGWNSVYRGVLISGCWNRGVPLYTEVFSFQLLYKEVSSFQQVGIETVYRDVLISGGWNSVYRGVLISGCWNRGVPLYTEVFSFQLLYKEVSSFQEVGIETVYRDVLISGGWNRDCIQRCSHFRGLE